MSSALRLPNGGYTRHTDVRSILSYLFDMKCVEVTGFSNFGKSSLMRLLAKPDVWETELGEASKDFLPLYVDCNRMLELTDQGFYELVLRCLRESDEVVDEKDELSAAYETLISPTSEFQVPLSFNRGLNTVITTMERKLILLLDEFDEPFQQIDSRVFLNLRAKKDRHTGCLAYVTATARPLATLRPGEHCAEFCELFIHQPWRLAPLTLSDVERYIHAYADAQELSFNHMDLDFVYQWAGGHPGLLSGVCQHLAKALRAGQNNDVDVQLEENSESGTGSAKIDHWPLHRELIPELRQDPSLQNESKRIWQGLREPEREALLALFSGGEVDDDILATLQQSHLIRDVDGRLRAFSRLFASFIQQQRSLAQQEDERLWVDTDSGAVLVDGEPTETLTRLEYELMLLLFENAGKIVDKYQIVADVWGEDYLDEVDDTRIEKLISRLRQKVETDSSSPQFITTVRGRGYRLLVS